MHGQPHIRFTQILSGTERSVTVFVTFRWIPFERSGLYQVQSPIFYTALTVHSKTENNNINSHTQDSTELQHDVILTLTIDSDNVNVQQLYMESPDYVLCCVFLQNHASFSGGVYISVQ